VTLLEYLGAIDAIVIRRDALEKTIAELIPGSPWEQTVARLRCLRGIDTLSAVGRCAEVGEFERFLKARQLMHHVGCRGGRPLVPRESIRDLSMSSPPSGWPRSILDSRALTTKTGPAETVSNPCTRV
jgi:hypothetical protein